MTSSSTTVLAEQGIKFSPDRYVKCYVASKLAHAPKLLALRADWPRVHFTARWVLTAALESERGTPAPIWIQNNVDDIARAEVVLVYAEAADELKGAIWEAGVAWTLEKEIWLVGDNRSYSQWKHAPRIHHGRSLEASLAEISARAEYRESHVDRIERRIGELALGLADLKTIARAP